MLVNFPSKVSPRRKQSLRGWILIVCLGVWTQGAAAEVIDARVGQTATLTAPVTVNMLTSAWYRGTALTPPQEICTCFVSPPSQVNGPQYTGRETCGPDGYLVIRDLLMNNTGNYTVNVQPNGAASVQATRQMRVDAQRVKVRDEVTGFVGQDVTLPCTLPIDDPSIKITQVTWLREAGGKKTIVAVYNPSFGTNLPIKHISFLQPSLTEPTLVITGLQMADEGAYTCEFATYPNGNEEGTTKLVLLAEPTNNAEAVPGVVEDQQITVANCTSANGKPPSEITWQSVIPGNISTTVTNNTSGTLTVNSQYSIFPTSAANGKTVTCVISSRTAKVPQSIPVVLSIQYPPEVSITGYDDNWYINRQQVELKCSASGNPPPTKYEWKTTNGKPLPKTVDVIGNLLVVRTVDYLVNTTFFCEASNARGTRSAQLGVFVRGDKELTAEDNTNDQQSQSPPPAHRLSEVDSKDSLDDELLAGPSHVPQTQRSHDPILPTTTSAATTTQQTPAATASTTATTIATTATATNTTRTTTTTCSNLPVPRDEEPTPTAVEGRERVHGPPVAREEVRGGRTSGRARVTTRPREEWTPSLDHFTRVVEAYQEVQGQSGRSDEFMRELIQLMRSIDNRLGQMVDLMGQQVALQRDRPVSQPPPPSSPVVPQDDSAPSSPAPTERDESPDVAGQSAGPPPKRTRGRPKKSLVVTGGTAPTTPQSRSQP